MFLERLLNQGSAPVLEQMLRFTDARHKLLAENIANVDTPGYRQKDLPLDNFQAALREQIADRSVSGDEMAPLEESSDNH